MRLQGFPVKFVDFLSRAGESGLPKWVIIHLGGNDLVNEPLYSIINKVFAVFSLVRAQLPGVQVVWSEILPRVAYRGAFDQGKIEKVRKAINRRARVLMGTIGGHVIRHPSFSWTFRHLFRRDGVHLSDQGQVFFIDDLRKGLALFKLYPQFFQYPLF